MGLLTILVCIALGAGACSAASSEDDPAAIDGALQRGGSAGTDGVLYFHGVARLGFTKPALDAELWGRSWLAPMLTDADLTADLPRAVTDFLGAQKHAIAAGYSAGRVPLMMSEVPGMTRAILIDPTNDGSSTLGWCCGGPIAKDWLDGDPQRTFLLVYGDVTRAVGGERSYVTELSHHPRAALCYLPGDHERFRRADMAAALDAKGCADLEYALGAKEQAQVSPTAP